MVISLGNSGEFTRLKNRLDDVQAEIIGLQRECKQIRHEMNLSVIQGTLHKEETGV